MKHSTYKYRREIFTRIWGILVLAVFLNAMLLESLHHHGAKEITHHNSHSKYNTQLGSAKLKCKLCEVLKHQSHFFYLPAPFALFLPLNKPGVKPCAYLIKRPVAYILSYANKGPPGLLA
ncbi:hypothetical protein IM793_11875 [Pedobacter sp. MR2016-19]|uniref:hypothetical protein n=1 Tax=Pedobacter sp. MR2016-19 TaxID=2780089 RepID=UPI001877295B|nr:hypothetical protein [Pedobacter sp. MR2016-19]MBE5319860.1 hypothetical protein [Pedobacter sp. MR2016-19]